MKLEYLLGLLELSGVIIHNKESIGDLDENYDLNRTINFSVGGKEYKIVWYHNMSNLYLDDNTQVMFNGIKCQNTWSVLTTDRSKNQLQFMYDSNKVCIMITDRYQ